MIFGVLELEGTIQENDKTRLDARKSYVTSDEMAITLVEIETDSGDGFIDITSDKFYDFQYSTDGTKTVSVRITTGGGGPDTFTKTLDIISAVDDKLFSADSELLPYEPNILEWVRVGRNSFLDVHREAQEEILRYLDKNGFHDADGEALDKSAIIDIDEVNKWSLFMVLKLIFSGINNAVDDIFKEKAKLYREKEFEARNRVILRLDVDGDGEADSTEAFKPRMVRLIKS